MIGIYQNSFTKHRSEFFGIPTSTAGSKTHKKLSSVTYGRVQGLIHNIKLILVVSTHIEDQLKEDLTNG